MQKQLQEEVTEGVIDSILEHKLTEDGTHALLIYWQNDKPSWEPFQEIYKDVPRLVVDYFRSKSINIDCIL